MEKRIWPILTLCVLTALGAFAAQHKLTLVNLNRDKVIVEVREGDQPACADRELIGQRELARGKAWSNLPCGRPCWRKKLPGSEWGPWISTTCISKSETYEIH